MAIGDTIKRLRASYGLSQSELGKIAGVTDKAVSTWENGEKIPRMGAIEKMAAYFGVTKGYLVDGNESYLSPDIIPPGFEPLPAMKLVPLLGSVACGEPILADENIEEYIGVPEGVKADFALACKGDSMIGARVLDGDIVFIQQQPDVDNGEIAAVLIGTEATLKRVYKIGGMLELRAENPNYSPMRYEGERLTEIRIIGKAVAFLSQIRN